VRDRFDVLTAEEIFAALLDGYAVDRLASDPDVGRK
jgi:hypothetical protein